MEFKENAGPHPPGIFPGNANLDSKPVYRPKGRFQPLFHQKIRIVIKHFHRTLAVELISPHSQFRRQLMLGKKLHKLPHAHPVPKFLTDGPGLFPGDAGHFCQPLRFPLHDHQSLIPKPLHDPGSSLGTNALNDPAG